MADVWQRRSDDAVMCSSGHCSKSATWSRHISGHALCAPYWDHACDECVPKRGLVVYVEKVAAEVEALREQLDAVCGGVDTALDEAVAAHIAPLLARAEKAEAEQSKADGAAVSAGLDLAEARARLDAARALVERWRERVRSLHRDASAANRAGRHDQASAREATADGLGRRVDELATALGGSASCTCREPSGAPDDNGDRCSRAIAAGALVAATRRAQRFLHDTGTCSECGVLSDTDEYEHADHCQLGPILVALDVYDEGETTIGASGD